LEGSKYLELAERIISARGVPLTGHQIIDFANKFDALPYGSYGTIVKTLQARIAEDIAKNRRKSRFLRTGIGTYFLQSLAEQHTIYGKIKWTGSRAARTKPEHPHRILTVPRQRIPSDLFREGWEEVADILAQGIYAYQSEIEPDHVSVVTGVVLSWRSNMLTYQLGVHTHFENMVGQRTAIFRKFLDEFDLDLFETDGTGATSSTARTILPVLSNGRRARLESGKLTETEQLQFFQVAEHLTGKSALWSEKMDCLVLLSIADISEIFPTRPETKRRLEQNDATWVKDTNAYSVINEDDSIRLISSLGLIESDH
tara:strand:- start:2477 stop:3418 length:942 start_codon:yes stop_codon:yes gene_type:complete